MTDVSCNCAELVTIIAVDHYTYGKKKKDALGIDYSTRNTHRNS